MNKTTIRIGISLILLSLILSCRPTQVDTSNRTQFPEEKQRIDIFNRTQFSQEKQIKGVYMQVISISSDKALIEFSNATDKSIYLSYPTSNIKNPVQGFANYQLLCKESSRKESKDYSPNIDGISSLESLEKDKSFYFEIINLPKIKATCEIQVGYYDDEKIANLINTKIWDLDESETASIEKAKRSVKLNFGLAKK
jgi:hypothetical protein